MDQTLKDALTQILGSRAVLVLGQFAIGIGLMYLIDKFFTFVEDHLAETTKLGIAVWLLDLKVGQKVEPWPDTFAQVFDRVFGSKHLSWKCFSRSCFASCASLGISLLALSVDDPFLSSFRMFLSRVSPASRESAPATVLIFVGCSLFGNVVPDYLSLLKSRRILKLMGGASLLGLIGYLSLDLLLTITLATFSLYTIGYVFFLIEYWGVMYEQTHGFVATMFFQVHVLLSDLRDHQNSFRGFWPIWFYPAFFTSVWIWLYAGSGFLLKAARRLDLGFRKLDIEQKPLSSIGLVAGVTVAVLYWSAVIVSMVVR
jgi:hypothetical protein